MLEVGGEFAKVCPSVCSTNSCCRASRVLYPEAVSVLRWKQLGNLFSHWSAKQLALCVEEGWEGDGH